MLYRRTSLDAAYVFRRLTTVDTVGRGIRPNLQGRRTSSHRMGLQPTWPAASRSDSVHIGHVALRLPGVDAKLLRMQVGCVLNSTGARLRSLRIRQTDLIPCGRAAVSFNFAGPFCESCITAEKRADRPAGSWRTSWLPCPLRIHRSTSFALRARNPHSAPACLLIHHSTRTDQRQWIYSALGPRKKTND